MCHITLMCSCENAEFNDSFSNMTFLGCCNCTHEPVCVVRRTVLTEEDFFFLFSSSVREKK